MCMRSIICKIATICLGMLLLAAFSGGAWAEEPVIVTVPDLTGQELKAAEAAFYREISGTAADTAVPPEAEL